MIVRSIFRPLASNPAASATAKGLGAAGRGGSAIAISWCGHTAELDQGTTQLKTDNL
jgi:hypothetical protein